MEVPTPDSSLGRDPFRLPRTEKGRKVAETRNPGVFQKISKSFRLCGRGTRGTCLHVLVVHRKRDDDENLPRFVPAPASRANPRGLTFKPRSWRRKPAPGPITEPTHDAGIRNNMCPCP